MIITTGASTPRRRPVLRIGLVAVLTALAAVGFAGPAAAHDVLISSDPADGSTLQTAPATVTLTFDQPVQNFEPVVTMTGPDGQSYQSGSPTVDSTVVTSAVGEITQAGEYVIAFRVVSADGHPVTGEVKFQFAGAALAVESAGAGSAATGTSAAAPTSGTAATSAATPTSAAVSTVAVAPASSSSGLSGWVWAALALAAVLIIAAVVVVLRRPRQSG